MVSWDNTYFCLSDLSQVSMVLFQLQLTYFYYLELMLTVLQNYRITVFVNPWLSPLKHKKWKINNNKWINKLSTKDHRYIYWVFHCLGISRSLSTPTDNSKYEIFLVKISNLKQNKKVKYFQLLQKKSNFYFSRKQPMVPLDKGLQWVNVKQKQLRLNCAYSDITRHI